VSLGGKLAVAEPDDGASALAIAAANAIGTDLAGVDLLPLEDGSHVVLELNGAVDFDDRYSMHGGDVYLAAAAALGLRPVSQSAASPISAPEIRGRSRVRILTD
jgi:glutathione synthase/RimK-type ligase-like ATP-grasp enzyme